MSRTSRRAALWVVAAGLLPACGAGVYQTARTLPPGEFRAIVAQGFVYTELTEEQGMSQLNFEPDFAVRVGVAERVDVGFQWFFVGGGLVDAKVNVLPLDSAFALAFRGGFGAAADVGRDAGSAWLLHVPLSVLASYTYERVTPYVSFGYGFFWIFGRSLTDPPENLVPEERRGYGDGVLRATGGLAIELTRRISLCLEYTYMPGVVDDPGDNYTFVDSHIVGVASTF